MRVRNSKVRIGDLVLGKQPVYCVTVLESTATAAAAAATAAMQAGADCLELRLDKLKDLSEVGALVRAVRSPAIGVCRRPKWDGFFEGSERERVSRLFKAIEEGIPAVDVDLITPPALRRDVIRAAKARGTTVMISYENFQRTPSAARLLRTLREEKALGAEIGKFAVMATSYRDVLTVLDVTIEARRRLGIPFVAIAMGAWGSSSRPVGLLFGAAMTYGCTAKGKEGAPGQLPVAEVRQIVESLAGEPGKSSVSDS
jgi:3-dehydroquinate dehydratase-1